VGENAKDNHVRCVVIVRASIWFGNMRLFFALWPDDQVRLALAQHRLDVTRLAGGRPTLPVTLHMTLVFAGNVPRGRLLEMQMLAARVQAKPFDYIVDTAGCFPGPKVAWLASDSPPQALFDLQQSLQSEIKQADFDVDERTFRPHITVTRHIASAFEPYPIEATHWAVKNFALIEAEQEGSSINYEIVDTWPLLG
jgi:RNA 2',3'-cyclic 3'-phosphodiesterase